MIICHKMKWNDCLSHQIWPDIEKGWKDGDKKIHFFWGLGGANVPEIQEVERLGEEWWYVDVGYITEQITRYPLPKINDIKNTYFRIIKGHIHTQTMKPDNDRLKNVSVNNWQNNDGHILLCPSSPTVTRWISGISQDEWSDKITNVIKEYTDRPIRFRNKPRPGNQWFETSITDDLEGAYALVTNMSLSAVDAIVFGIPAFTHIENIASPVSNTDISNINNPMKPNKQIINEWLNCVGQNQFTLEEIGNGIAYDILKKQDEDTIL
tara:strand:+ start:476 stop:1273 length:798 start_codon:yes stop_codon:yes gene_type:complete